MDDRIFNFNVWFKNKNVFFRKLAIFNIVITVAFIKCNVDVYGYIPETLKEIIMLIYMYTNQKKEEMIQYVNVSWYACKRLCCICAKKKRGIKLYR